MADQARIASLRRFLDNKTSEELFQAYKFPQRDAYTADRQAAILQILGERSLEIDSNGNLAPVEKLLMTTSVGLEGYKVIETIEVITAECVFGMNVIYDMFAGLTDFFGGRSKSTQEVLRNARRTCLRELENEAKAVGANAIIAIDLDYSEFSGQGKSMLFLVASGTAVKVERIAT